MGIKIIKKVNCSILNEKFSRVPNFRFENFLIGSEKKYYKHITAGNTIVSKYNTLHFGLNLVNNSDSNTKIVINISKIDKKGYSLDNFEISNKINSKEKKQIWSDINLFFFKDLKKYEIKNVTVSTENQKITKNINAKLFDICNVNIFDILFFRIKIELIKLFNWFLSIMGSLLIRLGLIALICYLAYRFISKLK